MPDKFNRPTSLADALYHDALSGDIRQVEHAIRNQPELISGKAVVDGAWSHGARRCGAQDDVIECLHLLAAHGADFKKLGPGTYDSAFKAFPRAAALLFELGADAGAQDEGGETGLHRMAAIGNRYACEVLLNHGAAINAKNKDGETPLDVAVKLNLPRMTEFLRESGAKPGSAIKDGDSVAPTRQGSPPRDGHTPGEVAWYRTDRGYGYLRDYRREPRNGSLLVMPGLYGELFFDRESIVSSLPSSMEEGTPLRFEVVRDEFGLRATNVEFD